MDLERFVKAQEHDYPIALREIRNGKKVSHWMWYIFPQIRGLGRSDVSRYYAIESLEEAKAYLAHPILGSRLREISQALLDLNMGDAYAIFGAPDHMKLRSSMTLFARAGGDAVFQNVLERFFGGNPDKRTLNILKTL